MGCSALKTVLMLRIILLSILSCSLYACRDKPKEVLPYYDTPDFTPVFIPEGTDPGKQVTHQIGAFSFTDQHNQVISRQSLEGKVHVANFFFTGCGSICPVMTRHLKMVDSSFENEPGLVLLSYSVTPWIDKVNVLQQYAAKHHIDNPNWHLLTGSKGAIYNLARTSYFAEEELGFTKDSTNFLHTEHFLLIDRHQRIRGIYNGTLQLETEQLIKDIKELLQEKDNAAG
jgi:protein SCO1/2